MKRITRDKFDEDLADLIEAGQVRGVLNGVNVRIVSADQRVDKGLKMDNTIQDAKRTIAASSLEGMRLLGAGVSKPCAQVRYNIAAQAALADAGANLTPDQRTLIASFIESTEPETRGYTLRVRLTESERDELQSRADSEQMELSEYVRRALSL
jgi:hypothetical protein